MSVREPRYSKEELARRGDEIYAREIRPLVEPEHRGKFVAIDIETGAYALDADDYLATERLLARCPDAQVWLMRVGFPFVDRLGSMRS